MLTRVTRVSTCAIKQQLRVAASRISLLTHPSATTPSSCTSAPLTSRISSATSSRLIHRSSVRSASHTIIVPPMGDSISEGTVNEIAVNIGNGVRVDDVVARLDTDKVTVDIRSTHEGQVKKWFAKVGDTIKVGAPLLEIEIGAAGTNVATSGNNVKPMAPIQSPAALPNPDVGEKKPAPLAQSGTQSPISTNPTDPHDRVRVPLIQFRFGKRDASGATVGSGQRLGHQHQGNQPAAFTGGLDFLTANEAAAAAWEALPARYKKKVLKDAQLALIELGGAENYESKKKVRA